MNFVVGKKLFEFAEQLGSESFVVRQNQRRHVLLSDNIRHCKSFTATRHAEQHLLALAVVQTIQQLGDRLRLIASRLIRRL